MNQSLVSKKNDVYLTLHCTLSGDGLRNPKITENMQKLFHTSGGP